MLFDGYYFKSKKIKVRGRADKKGIQEKVKLRFADQTNKIKKNFSVKKDVDICNSYTYHHSVKKLASLPKMYSLMLLPKLLVSYYFKIVSVGSPPFSVSNFICYYRHFATNQKR